MISQIRFGLHCLPVPISDLFNLSQSSQKRECPSTAEELDSRTYTEAPPGMDRVRRFYAWERDEEDGAYIGSGVCARTRCTGRVVTWVQVLLSDSEPPPPAAASESPFEDRDPLVKVLTS